MLSNSIIPLINTIFADDSSLLGALRLHQFESVVLVLHNKTHLTYQKWSEC